MRAFFLTTLHIVRLLAYSTILVAKLKRIKIVTNRETFQCVFLRRRGHCKEKKVSASQKLKGRIHNIKGFWG